MNWQYNKIPKTCFFYWGNTKLSFLNYLSLVSFKEHNPEWRAVLVRPSDDLVVEPPTNHHSQGYIGEKDYIHQALRAVDDILEIDFQQVLNLKADFHDAQRADITRLYTLGMYGGMWSDMDVLYIKPNTNINFSKYLITPTGRSREPIVPKEPHHGIEKELDTVICYQNAGLPQRPWNSTGALFSSKNNPLYTLLFHDARVRISKLGENKVKNYQMLGPNIFDTYVPNVLRKIPELTTANMPYKVFYPWGWWGEIEEFFNEKNEDRIPEETVAIHWFKGDPNSSKYLNKNPKTIDSSSHFGYYTLMYKELW
jgi:hypothetical protein